jgi:DNA-binding MarR family transcriptional regulator/GNAT superfamily N-acetyltransferase
MPARHTTGRIARVRRFNRFYTKTIGVLQEGLLGSPFTLTEVRVLYELAHRDRPTAGGLAGALDLDQGYLSRILRRLAGKGLVRAAASSADGRQRLLSLSSRGRRAFKTLDRRSSREVASLLGRLSPAAQDRLVAAMDTIESLLGGSEARAASSPIILRPPQPGDLGWVVHRHGVLYAREEGYDERFEALVAGIVAEFVRRFDPKVERCWIAECHGVVSGSVFLVRQSKTVAKLRLLLLEPEARGIGLGRRLVEECVRFAKHAGYRTIRLWTQQSLRPARRLYQRAGFRLLRRERHDSFGKRLVGETWELTL